MIFALASPLLLLPLGRAAVCCHSFGTPTWLLCWMQETTEGEDSPLSQLDGLTTSKHSAAAPITRDVHAFFFGFHVTGSSKKKNKEPSTKHHQSVLLAVVFHAEQELHALCTLAASCCNLLPPS